MRCYERLAASSIHLTARDTNTVASTRLIESSSGDLSVWRNCSWLQVLFAANHCGWFGKVSKPGVFRFAGGKRTKFVVAPPRGSVVPRLAMRAPARASTALSRPTADRGSGRNGFSYRVSSRQHNSPSLESASQRPCVHHDENFHHVSFAHLGTRRRFVRPGIEPAVYLVFAHGGNNDEEVGSTGTVVGDVFGLRSRLVPILPQRRALQ